MRDSTIIYRSFYEAIIELPKENQADLWNAIFEYSLNFKLTELSGLNKTIFNLIKPNLDANIKRFENGNKQKVSKTEAKQKQKVSKTEANKDKDVDKDVDKEIEDKSSFVDSKIDNVNWQNLLINFNNITGKKCTAISDKTKKQIKMRLKEGFTKEVILDAIRKCSKDAYHIENNLKYLTLEFISRADKLEKYAVTDKKPTGPNYFIVND